MRLPTIQTLIVFILSRPWLVDLNAITGKFTARKSLHLGEGQAVGILGGKGSNGEGVEQNFVGASRVSCGSFFVKALARLVGTEFHNETFDCLDVGLEFCFEGAGCFVVVKREFYEGFLIGVENG